MLAVLTGLVYPAVMTGARPGRLQGQGRRFPFVEVDGKTESEVEDRAAAIMKLEGQYHPGLTVGDIPVDLLTASSSGLDPDISEAAALLQAPRIAAVNGLTVDVVRQLVAEHLEGKQLGFLGEPTVNVLELNLALQGLSQQ